MKTLLHSIIGLLLCVQPLLAESFTVVGEVAAINEISVEKLGLESGLLGEVIQHNQQVPVAKFRVSNNDEDGFYINISSQNQGNLISVENPEDRVAYTVSTEVDPLSYHALGTAEPAPLIQKSLSTDAQLVFDTNVHSATIGHGYILSITSSEDIKNFSHLYADRLIVTIHDL